MYGYTIHSFGVSGAIGMHICPRFVHTPSSIHLHSQQRQQQPLLAKNTTQFVQLHSNHRIRPPRPLCNLPIWAELEIQPPSLRPTPPSPSNLHLRHLRQIHQSATPASSRAGVLANHATGQAGLQAAGFSHRPARPGRCTALYWMRWTLLTGPLGGL
jgi:hypothetical protein